MDKHRAVESGEFRIQQKRLQNVQYGDRANARYSISRPSSSRTSSPLFQPISSAALANWFTQFKDFSAEVSRSVVRYPYTWLAATWIVLVFTGGVAAVLLFKIAPMEPEQSIASAPTEHSAEHFSSIPLPDQPQNAPKQSSPQPESQDKASLKEQSQLTRQTEQKGRLPLFALGTVAFSCAIGCLWLSYRLTSRPSKPQSRLPARTPRLPRPSTATQHSVTRAPETGKATRAEARSSNVNVDATTIATTTLLAAHESHPLDWDEPSLADNLDIRQQRPLSHWL